MKNNQEAKKTREIQYKQYAEMKKEQLLDELGTSEHGINSEQTLKQTEKYGKNILMKTRKVSLLKRLIGAFFNPFTIVLAVVSTVSFFTDIIYAPIGQQDPSTVILISIMVTISGVMRFTQETKSGKEAERLKSLVVTKTDVMRDGEPLVEIALGDVVVGDIVLLAAGDIIPADLRVIEAMDLFISQSALTGESEPIEKIETFDARTEDDILTATNLLFMGTTVVSGSGKAVVISVGNETVFGQMAKSIVKKKVVTNFDKGIQTISWVLIGFMLIMVPTVFIINGITKNNWLEAFLFALSIAIGLTPQMLPMIVTTNLSKGAVLLAKKQVVVKNINSIQNFGSMDILCTDKTGTLTQDKVALRYYLNLEGEKDLNVLKHAYFNSYFQTGLRNLMDIAILNDADDQAFLNEIEQYNKIDEIPFDFTRRRMSVVIEDKQEKRQLITKGAIEEMLAVSSKVDLDGVIQDLDDIIRAMIQQKVQAMNDDGMRVLALAYKNDVVDEKEFTVEDESEMILMGYLAFLEPPKETTEKALNDLESYGIQTKILTGDNAEVTVAVCKQVGMSVGGVLLGSDIKGMDDETLSLLLEQTNIFAKIDPEQKARIVTLLRKKGHTVGYMGDGINDAAAMKVADVAISVDTAVDIAKESADIILLEKDLQVLIQGVMGGRKIYANIIKYIKMTVSSNFGNMLSILVASAFLPFLPMLPLQILILNLIYDISCLSIPWDDVDESYLKEPRHWDAKGLTRFMVWIGPTSSVFDIITYGALFLFIIPFTLGTHYQANADMNHFIQLFQTGWFLESLMSQMLVIHIIRTEKIPFIQSNASKPVLFITSIGILVGMYLPFSIIASSIGMAILPWFYYPFLLVIIILYLILANIVKKLYIKKFAEWL